MREAMIDAMRHLQVDGARKAAAAEAAVASAAVPAGEKVTARPPRERRLDYVPGQHSALYCIYRALRRLRRERRDERGESRPDGSARTAQRPSGSRGPCGSASPTTNGIRLREHRSDIYFFPSSVVPPRGHRVDRGWAMGWAGFRRFAPRQPRRAGARRRPRTAARAPASTA